MAVIPRDALVVVADGGQARLFRNRGNERDLMLHQFEILELVNANDDGPAGVMPDGATGYRIDEATFAKQLAERLNDGALKQQYDDVVLVADDKTLGAIRPLLHKETLDRMRGEVAKTLTNTPLDDIQRILSPPRD